MESLSLLPDLLELPASEGVAALDHDETVTRIKVQIDQSGQSFAATQVA